jgi:prepilin-type processing-associated H-X9-DG protein
MWDVTEVNGTGPSYGSQYVVGYEIDGGSFLSTKIPPNRYRQIADDPNYIPIGDPLRNDVPILPGSNREATVGVNDGQAGNIRWRHGNQDAANFLFADGTVRTLKMTTGTFGQANFKGEALHKYFRIKTPPGFNKRRG